MIENLAMPSIPEVTVKSGYQPQAIDTSLEADILLFQLLRQLTPQQKVQRTRAFHQAVRRLALLGIKKQHPHATEMEIQQEFIQRCLGAEWIQVLFKALLNNPNSQDGEQILIGDPIALAQKIAEILLPLNIPYVVGGSVASSLLGENRATQDLDIVIALDIQTAPQLIEVMIGEFHISESAVQEAIIKANITPCAASFNAIYLPSIEKVDFFVMSSDDPFANSVMNRRQLYDIGNNSDGKPTEIYIYSPEDIVLKKLSCYQLIPDGSQKQWRDVLGVLKVNREGIDRTYLTQWARILQLTDLLDTALVQAGF